ncbi:cell wall integrity and stress response component 4-like [Chlorella sorokiniana]|uniref:Cell wall integrity and stress response component 4-like n=1 Tax=Chlorella sorokiniana TaxID=3076 RepID=A0A2P6THK2_CHLSO|nr:cell wall integrity and stress response component 4-like [Chlorella sorokiniana]|eukprot:PRW33768.1 cell wall integrity and stress response component 4-like [Chlorella sorokiniana]
MKAGEPVAIYSEGEVIDISVFITAHHGGRHAFRLCTDLDASERCLSQHLLERADWGGPYSWTKTTGGSAPGAEVKKGSLSGQGGERYTWRYRLPPGVSCTRCVLQWWWTTANSCRVPGAPAWVGSDPGMLPCTDRNTHPEEFRNCADISIKKRSRGSDDGSDDDGTDSKNGNGAKSAAALAKPAVAPAKPAAVPAKPAVAPAKPAAALAKPAPVKPADGAVKPAGDKPAASNATAVQQQEQERGQSQLPASSPASLNSTLPAALQQPQKPRAAPTAAGDGADADIDDTCKELGGGLHTLPLTCPKFLLCAGGKGWVLYCPKGMVWDGASQACVAGPCEDTSSAQ